MALKLAVVAIPVIPLLWTLVLKIFKERSLPCAKINTDVDTCRKNLRKVSQNIVTWFFRETFGHFADLMTGSFLIINTTLNLTWRNLNRSFRKLPVSKTFGVFYGRATERYLWLSRSRFSEHFTQYARYSSGSKNDRFLVQSSAGKLSFCSLIIYILNLQISSRLIIDTILRSTLSLSHSLVVLIKDLNGNHVIQKCLNKLAPEDNQVHIPVAFLSTRWNAN